MPSLAVWGMERISELESRKPGFQVSLNCWHTVWWWAAQFPPLDFWFSTCPIEGLLSFGISKAPCSLDTLWNEWNQEKIGNMSRYPSWTNMYHILVSVWATKAWEHCRQWWSPTGQVLGLWMLIFHGISASLLSFHLSGRRRELKLFSKMTGSPPVTPE